MKNNKWRTQLERTSKYQDDWDGYGSPGPNIISIDLAEKFLTFLESKNIDAGHISPMADGGIAFTFRNNDMIMDICFLNDGDIDGGASGDGCTIPSYFAVNENDYQECSDKIVEFQNL